MKWHWLMAALVACNGPTKLGETGGPTLPATGEEGDPCGTSEDCGGGHVCSSVLICTNPNERGTTPAGEPCDVSADCEATLVCDGAQTCSSANAAGTAGIGEVCAGDGDCQAGLDCYESTCEGFQTELWTGGACVSDADEDFRVHFELPTGGHEDFYRLPFPSDMRTDLNGHPTYTHPVFGDLGAAWIDQARGWDPGPGQVVFFRLTELPEFDFAPGSLAAGAAVGAVDLADNAVHFTGFRYVSRRRYLCDPWLGVFPGLQNPWTPGHRYGVAVTTDVTANVATSGGPAAVQSTDLQGVLADSAPAGLEEAWANAAPFREGFTARPLDEVASFTHFQVRDVTAAGQALRDVIANLPAPEVAFLHDCADGPGPLSGDAGRGCDGTEAGFTELQGTLNIPHIQPGTAPFALPAHGGEADWSGGRPSVLETRQVAFSFSVPTGPVPVGGFPVLLFSHGAQGSYRSFVADGLATEWSHIPVGNDSGAFAILSIDTWLTGPRAGVPDADWASQFEPADEASLAYLSPLNPAAARDNIAQSALDWLTMLEWLEGVDWSEAGTSATGSAVTFDLSSLVFVGQDIGAASGPIFVSHEPRISSVVLGGMGGLWMDVMSEATEPFPPSKMLAPLLGDPNIDRLHPLLSIGQSVVDQTEPLHHLRGLGSTRNLLLVHGAQDGHVGVSAQESTAFLANTDQLVQSGVAALDGVPTGNAPVSGNVSGYTSVTLVNTGSDPHRLLVDDPHTRAQVTAFLDSGRAGTPTVPE